MIRHHHPCAGGTPDQRGAVIVLTAFSMVAILITAAIVIDLGYVRGGASFNQSNADLAALAGGDELARNKYREACEDIIGYVNTNATGIEAINATSFCATFGSTICSGSTNAQVTPTVDAGRYTVELRFPVPDAEIADPTFGTGVLDGEPCERITVSITSREPSFFGGVVDRDGYEVTRTATVRGGASQTRLVPALWLLDPVGCVVLSVQGGSQVIAGDLSDPNNPIPGVITLDSDTSDSKCSTSNTSLQAGGTGTVVRALPETGPPGERGEISLRGLPFNATTCQSSKACKPSEVGTTVFPQPIPAEERATRAPVDWLWNCKAAYPAYLGVPIEGCPLTDVRSAYIDRLVAALGGSGQPAGYQRWTDSYSCNPGGTIVATGNWWVNCGGNGLQMTNGTDITFTGGNVVFQSGIKLNGGASLKINTANPTTSLPSSCRPPTLTIPCVQNASSRAAFVYVRGGTWDLGGGALDARNTMIFLGGGGTVKGTGGAPPAWTAPTEGPFAGLALWSEAGGAYNISGGAGVSLRGTFFTPYADALSLSGGGNWGQQNAQFISYRLNVTGGSRLTMAPDPSSAVILPPSSATLIR